MFFQLAKYTASGQLGRIGVMIYNEIQEPCAGISVSGPTIRLSEDRAESLGVLVAEAANEIIHLSAGRGPAP